jgi:hypothetical protein
MRSATWLIAWTTLLTVSLAAASAQDKQTKEDKSALRTVIPIWPKEAPGSENWTQKETEFHFDKEKQKSFRNVVRPTLTAFLYEKSLPTGKQAAPFSKPLVLAGFCKRCRIECLPAGRDFVFVSGS